MNTPLNQENSKIVLGTPRPLPPHGSHRTAAELVYAPFPEQRTIRWTPKAPAAFTPEVRLVVTQEVLHAACNHTASDLTTELGGFLLGNRYRCPQSGQDYLMIDNCYKARFTKSDATSLLFSDNTWADLADKLSTRFFGKLLVGWYHSHPRMNIFLSEDDLTVHQARFSDSWSCALVLEPEKALGGFFVAREGRMSRTEPVEFYEYLAHGHPQSVVHWQNYECVTVEEALPDDFDLPAVETIAVQEAPPRAMPAPLPAKPQDVSSAIAASIRPYWKAAAVAALMCLAGGFGFGLHRLLATASNVSLLTTETQAVSAGMIPPPAPPTPAPPKMPFLPQTEPAQTAPAINAIPLLDKLAIPPTEPTRNRSRQQQPRTQSPATKHASKPAKKKAAAPAAAPNHVQEQEDEQQTQPDQEQEKPAPSPTPKGKKNEVDKTDPPAKESKPVTKATVVSTL